MEAVSDSHSVSTAIRWFQAAGTFLYYVSLPVVKLLLLIVYILRVCLSPFIYIGNAFMRLCLVPWHILAKFEVRFLLLVQMVVLTAEGNMVFLRMRNPDWHRRCPCCACCLANIHPSLQT